MSSGTFTTNYPTGTLPISITSGQLAFAFSYLSDKLIDLASKDLGVACSYRRWLYATHLWHVTLGRLWLHPLGDASLLGKTDLPVFETGLQDLPVLRRQQAILRPRNHWAGL